MKAAFPSRAAEHVSRARAAMGATITSGGARFALWSPGVRNAAVRFFADDNTVRRTERLERQSRGYFSSELPGVKAGALYKFVLDERELPDPYARFLPFGVHGPARVEPSRTVRPRSAFVPPHLERSVLYEIHIGAFTPEGTWRAALEKLPQLVDLGVTTLEIMPVGAFAGARGWGYDGVAPLAPFAHYGSTTDVRAFVDGAHSRGLAVILDVVLNHFGPDGNYFHAYSPTYFTAPQGRVRSDAPDFSNHRVRCLCLEIARTWLVEYEFDGLRLNATHAIVDESIPHILAELADFMETLEPKKILIADDDRNDPALIDEHGVDAVWADDFHHVVHTILTGERKGHYAGYEPTATELARVVDKDWVDQVKIQPPSAHSRGGTANRLGPSSFVYSLQNHDQVGNHAFGTRLHHDVDLRAHAAAAMLMLFLPTVPLLFMGEEWGTTKPFLYFTDHEAALGAEITRRRREQLTSFAGVADASLIDAIPDPQAATSFTAPKLDWAERSTPSHAALSDIYRRMIALRARDAILSRPSVPAKCEVQGPLLIVTRGVAGDERRLLFNTSRDVVLSAPDSAKYDLLLSSHENAGAALQPHSALLVSTRRRV